MPRIPAELENALDKQLTAELKQSNLPIRLKAMTLGLAAFHKLKAGE